MKRKAEAPVLGGSSNKHPRLNKETWAMEHGDTTKEEAPMYANQICNSRILTQDTIEHHIIPLVPSSWLYVSKQYSRAAINAMLDSMDPYRLYLYFERALCSGASIETLRLTASKAHFQPSFCGNALFQFTIGDENEAIVKLLLTHPKFDPTELISIDSHYVYYTPLDFAIHHNNSVAKYMLQELNHNPADNHNGAIRSAVRARNYEIFFLLLKDERVDPSIPTAEEGDFMTFKRDRFSIYFADGYEPTKNEPLMMASAMGDVIMVEALLKDPRVDPSSCDSRALLEAIDRDHLQIAKLLLQDERIRKSNKPQRLSYFREHCSASMQRILEESSY